MAGFRKTATIPGVRFIDPTPGLNAEYERRAKPLRTAMEGESSRFRRLRLRWKLTRVRSRYMLTRVVANWSQAIN
jgi:hypothetical protein